LDHLRRTIARMQTPAIAFEGPCDCPLGVSEVDQVLGGGLARGALHEIAASGEAHLAAATGFALGVAGCAATQAVVWVAQDMSLLESGAPYGPGLDDHGLAPERLLTVAGARTQEVLWVMEEALHCHAVGVVIGEVRGASRELDLVAMRRLSLAAATHGALALLLRSAPADEASAAVTRWVVGAAPARGGPTEKSRSGIGPPRFDLALMRNRRGPLGSWMLEWSVADASFVLAAHSEPVARTVVDRSRARAA
jgi:protein ImuA